MAGSRSRAARFPGAAAGTQRLPAAVLQKRRSTAHQPDADPVALRIVVETGARIAAAAPLEAALQELLAGVHRLTGAMGGGVRLLMPPSHDPAAPLTYRVYRWQGEEHYVWLEGIVEAGTYMAEVLASGHGVSTPDHMAAAARGHRFAARAVAEDHVQSSLIVPLRTQRGLIGTLHANAPRPHAFQARQLIPLQFLADHAAAAVERARLSAAAERAQQQMQAVLDATEEAMLMVSLDGRIVMGNRRSLALFQYREADLLGVRVADLAEQIHRCFGDAVDMADLLASLPHPEQRYALDLAQRWPEARTLRLSSGPVLAEGNTAIGRLFVFRDVTQERAADRMKDEFVAMVSHELRTPLTSIKGYTDLLLDPQASALTEEQREFLGIIQRNADREVALVNNLLDLSRLEAGHVALDRRRLDLAPLLIQVAASLRPQVAAKRQRLTLDLPPTLPWVLGDAARLIQIFTNLLSNAHKYTPPGGQITVSATVTDAALRVDVGDSGIGLSPDEVAQLFTRFFRAKHRTVQEAGGTGLGLAITRALVEQHGGQISVTTSPGQGVTFSVTVPRQTGGTGDGLLPVAP